MKKNRMMRLASCLLVLVLLSTCAISGTFAKYTSTATASDSARVAKWKFTVGGKNIANNEEISFDLFKTAEIGDIGGSETTDDLDVTNGAGTDAIIAPGTKGSFVIQLENASEVTATYGITYLAEQTNVPSGQVIPIQYSLDGSAWTSDISTLKVDPATAQNADEVNVLQAGGTKDITVYWQWVFSADDANDTALGNASALAGAGSEPRITVTATITATQID